LKERIRTVSEKLDVKGKTINQIARWYFNDELFVNRRYQRKLVWSLEEKKLFIDSIINKYPTPSIMINDFQELIDGKEYQRYEIVDGLQRLNAIFSFIIGEFGIEHENQLKYFNISHIPSAGVLLKDKNWKNHDNLLPDDICADFADSELPIILSGQDANKIEEIFRRINSSGKKLSSHDLRQAGSTGNFADLVRRVACRIRKDYTFEDSIKLYDMPKISVSNYGLNYGVDINEMFWRRHDIITCDNLRSSKDEEIIETLIASIFLGTEFKKSKINLDKLYESGSEINEKIENIIKPLDKYKLEDRFVQVFDTIDMIFDSVESNFSVYIFSKGRIKGKDECFKILFLAIDRILNEGYQVCEYKQVAASIKKASSIFNEFTTGKKIDYDSANNAVDNLYNIIKHLFRKKILKVNNEIINEITERLSYSKIERQMTEFKIGVSNFNSKALNIKCIQDIAKTLVAMSNLNNPTEDGLIIVGVADNKESYDNWNKIYHKPANIVNQHYLPGISSEAKKLFGNTDSYFRKIREIIETEPISPKLKEYILESFDVVDYYDVELLIFRSKNVGEVSLYNGEKYIRHSSETMKV